MKIGIAIDDWKLPIFERHLTAAGYSYVQVPGLTSDTLFINVHVYTDADLEKLKTVVIAAQAEAAAEKAKGAS